MTDSVAPEKRTSITDPLIINEIAHKAVVYGLTMLPGSKARAMGGPDWDRDYHADMAIIKAWKPDVLITCAPEEERPLYRGLQYGLKLHAVLHQDSPVSGNLTEQDLDREALKTLHTQIRTWSKSRPQRVLLISMRGLQRAGTLAGILLRMSGMEADAAISALNAARQFSVSTILQRRLISDTQLVPEISSLTSRKKRELLPPGIMEAKEAAEQIMKYRRSHDGQSFDHTPIPKAQALECLAKQRGWANWSTMSAALSSPGLPYPAHNPGARGLHHVLGLHTQDPEDMIKAWEALNTLPSGHEDLERRLARWLKICAYACFALHAARGVQVGADALRRAFSWDQFCVYVRAVAHGEISGSVADMIMDAAKEERAFSIDLALIDGQQSERAVEWISFHQMNITKVIGDLIEESRGKRELSGRIPGL